jgi:hypothetical protein
MINLLKITNKQQFMLQCAFNKIAYKIIPYKPIPVDKNGYPILEKNDQVVGVAQKFNDMVFVGDQDHVDQDGYLDEAMHAQLQYKISKDIKIPIEILNDTTNDAFATRKGYFVTRKQSIQLKNGYCSEEFLPGAQKLMGINQVHYEPESPYKVKKAVEKLIG